MGTQGVKVRVRKEEAPNVPKDETPNEPKKSNRNKLLLLGLALCIAIVVIITVFSLGGPIDALIAILDPTLQSILAAVPFLVGIPVVYYLLTLWAANRMDFINRYTMSVRRTKEPKYRELLGQYGKICGEGLPFGMRFFGEMKTKVEQEFARPLADWELEITSLDDSIINA